MKPETTDNEDARPRGVINQDPDFEPPEGLEQRYEETLRQTIKMLDDDEDRPLGFHLAMHRQDGVTFTTGMSPELIDGTGPTLPAVEMLSQHLLTVYKQTSGMGIDELALLAADKAEEIHDNGN